MYSRPSDPDSPKMQYVFWPAGCIQQQPFRCQGYVPPGTWVHDDATAGVCVRLSSTVHAPFPPGTYATVTGKIATAHERPVQTLIAAMM